MLELARQLWSLFNRRERLQLAALALLLVLRAGVEMVGVVSIMPFMKVVADPGIVQQNAYLSRLYAALGFSSVPSFLTALGVMVVILLAVTNTVSAVAVYSMLRFSWGMNHRLCLRLLKGYLSQSYGFFTQRNSASLNKTLLNEVQTVITSVLKPFLDVFARFLTICALIGLLVVMDPVLALAVAAVLGGAYGGIYMVIRKKQRRLGLLRVRANQERFKVTGEAFGGIKDVKVLQRERAFVERFRPASWQYSMTTASNTVMSQLPRYLIETIAFGGIVLIVLYYLQREQGVTQILPAISMYAFAGYRLLPELQNLFADVATIRFNRAALDDLLQDYQPYAGAAPAAAREPLPFARGITFQEVTFRYPNATGPALAAVSLHVRRNQTVGLVGASGSGKTTLVDLLLGLYLPEAGRILIDDVALDERTLSAWRRQVGYVPQHIFLTDDSIAANIAFGVPEGEIDAAEVERAARIANLHEFILTLPAGYETVVGERGVRLSGGQRQRIGIARALYHDPAVLVMDEATSALDGATETAVMEAIHELAGQKTIVLIAHRLSTVEDADLIYLLERGRIKDVGTYRELVAGSRAFRAMAGLDSAASL